MLNDVRSGLLAAAQRYIAGLRTASRWSAVRRWYLAGVQLPESYHTPR